MLSASLKSHPAPVPTHIAIIMDGNGRWAKKRLLPRAAGHRKGADAVRKAVKGCIEHGISYLTLFAFSSENWKRPADEIDDLMGLLRLYIRQELDQLRKNGVKVRFIGDLSPFSDDIRSLISDAEAETAANNRLVLSIALNYGSHAEIARAARSLAQDAADGILRPSDITEEVFAAKLHTYGLPDPDLLIRTSGEKRLSNFLLWQSAYTELLFLDTLWPDFNRKALASAIHEFQSRERRFGARS